MRNRIFSVDNGKAVKSQASGWLNAIHYLAPARSGSTRKKRFNLCPHAGACAALCLGQHSGRASFSPNVNPSRRAKARRFMFDRQAYLADMVRAIDSLVRRSARTGMPLCVRLNGSSDIAWESIAMERGGIRYRNLMECYPEVTFIDYTKNPRRFAKQLPANYYLTFSRAENNDHDARLLLESGHNVAVVFAGTMPESWNGFPVINGDANDLRHLDPRGGFVIGLSPKGNRAKRDTSGFVIRNAP